MAKFIYNNIKNINLKTSYFKLNSNFNLKIFFIKNINI